MILKNKICKLIKYIMFSLFCSAVLTNTAVLHAFSRTEKTSPAPEYPFFRLEPYNDPAGAQKLNLFKIEKTRQIVSKAVISPDKTRAAYTEADYFPQTKQTSGRLFYINIPLPQPTALSGEIVAESPDIYSVKTSENPGIKILTTGKESMIQDLFKTLTIVDWSENGKKLLVKETLGENQRNIRQTDLWVYDFETKNSRKLVELRNAVIYYWSKKHNFRLDDFRWDITPLGWAVNDKDLIIANVYGYNDNGKQFLGAFGIDSEGKTSRLLSMDNENLPVSKNGLVLIIEGEKHYYQPSPF